MIVPIETKPLIKLQRTGYRDPIREYVEQITREYNELESMLPKTCNSILDIGCGIAGIDVFLFEHYHNRPCLNLVDRDRVDENIYFGYKAKTSFYNKFDIVDKVMEVNKITDYNLIAAETGNDITSIIGEQDIIISLLSCGYHYPVDTYLNKIVELISNDGILIMDIRQGTDGIQKLKQYFSEVKIISDYNKSNRVVASGISS